MCRSGASLQLHVRTSQSSVKASKYKQNCDSQTFEHETSAARFAYRPLILAFAMRSNILLATPRFVRPQVIKVPIVSCRRSLSLTLYQHSGCCSRERRECFKFLNRGKLSSTRTYTNCSTANSSDEQGFPSSSAAAEDPSGISGQHVPQEAPTDDDANLAYNHWLRINPFV